MLLHPNSEKIPIYWTYFTENCSAIKIFHSPTATLLFTHITGQLDSITPGQQVFLFAIYFAVVVSLCDKECLRVLGGERDFYIRLYQYAVDQSLIQARLQDTEEPIVVQALFVYLSSAKGYCTPDILWSLTSVTVQLAQKMFLHREGNHSPFITELRRRLWWGVFWLDARASEDSGYHSTIQLADADVDLPLNVDDCELTPCMPDLPGSRSGWTEMSFSRAAFKAASVFNQLKVDPSKGFTGCEMADMTRDIFERSESVMAYQRHLDHFPPVGSVADSFTEYASIAGRITLNLLWLLTYYPYLFKCGRSQLPQEIRRSLLLTSIYVVEMTNLLCQRKEFQKWKWFTKTFTQCYALKHIVLELCLNTEGELVERAWSVIDMVREQNVERGQSNLLRFRSEGIELGANINAPLNKELVLLNTLLRRARLEKRRRAGSSEWEPDNPETERVRDSSADDVNYDIGSEPFSLDYTLTSEIEAVDLEINDPYRLSANFLQDHSLALLGSIFPEPELF